MSLLDGVTQRVIQEWFDENHPLIVSGACVNSKQRKYSCTKCRDICPEGVYGADGPAWERCKNCNLCVAGCPAQAICPSSTVLKNFLRTLNDEDAVIVGCSRGEADADLKLDCLGTLPWEMVVRIALQKKLVLDTAPCPSCPRAEEKAQLLALLTRAQTFLGAENFRKCVRLGAVEQPDRPGVSRRQAFSDLVRAFKSTVATLLPDDELERPAYSAVYRKLLVNYLLKKEAEETVPEMTWDVPIISDACTGCTVCSKTCVHDAIELVDPSESDGMRHLRHYGGRCTRCGLCEALCPQRAITGWATLMTTDPLGANDTAITAEPEPQPAQAPLLTSLRKQDWQRRGQQAHTSKEQ